MRVGIIGGGFGLRIQAPIIKVHPSMDVSAVCTMNRHQLPNEILSWEPPPKHYLDWAQMLNKEKMDILFVSSMPIHHYEIVKYAIKKGINIVCEKPFTMNSNESRELLNLATENNVKILIDFEWRYLPIRQKVKEIIEKNHIGKVIHFEYHISSPRYQYLQNNKLGWLGEKQKFGGMLGALGTHMIDCLSWLVKDEIEDLSGFVYTHVPQAVGEHREADDAFFIHGKMKGNSTFSIQLISGINHSFGANLRVFGSLGTVALHNDQELYFGKTNEKLNEINVIKPEIPAHQLSGEAIAYFPAFYPFLEKVYEYMAFEKLDQDLPTIVDGHKNQVILDKVLAN
ncbi:Gfo/Idh/MocA family protein [Cytobacillus solani]|uniref:Oxidoreductase n=1 Tax=Cytobacillus solani TaxID=1637975 RepID=A0A0Q3QUD3_9BACI|nr:Gfo/Idh/MocA family oxidoreductase [Cytobacillus solani]KQL21208.1 oxidoreductase [Cytobacillus solani]